MEYMSPCRKIIFCIQTIWFGCCNIYTGTSQIADLRGMYCNIKMLLCKIYSDSGLSMRPRTNKTDVISNTDKFITIHRNFKELCEVFWCQFMEGYEMVFVRIKQPKDCPSESLKWITDFRYYKVNLQKHVQEFSPPLYSNNFLQSIAE